MLHNQIAIYLQGHPLSSKKEIKEGLGFSGSDASFKRYLQRGVAEGIIKVEGKGRARRYSTAYGSIFPTRRKYPDGIQTFDKIIQEGYVYIDKTDLIYELTNENSRYLFFSRPRRFGKSLLISTLQAYFEGRKELFEGMAISKLEKQWNTYPVVRLDLSTASDALNVDQLYSKLGFILREAEEAFDLPAADMLPGDRLYSLVKQIFLKSGKRVVLLIDEYDAPLLSALYEEQEPAFKRVLKEFFSPVKKLDPYLQFTFLSGITKFSQLSIFSTLNNLRDISLNDRYAALCGFTNEEIEVCFADEISLMARNKQRPEQEIKQQLKQRYDGYHFTPSCIDVYNPYSVLCVFSEQEMFDFWFASGTPTLLFKTLQRFQTDLFEIDGVEVLPSVFSQPTESVTNAVSLFYQSGYLTIQSYSEKRNSYILSIPNAEVRAGLMDNLMPIATGRNQIESQNLAIRFKRALLEQDIPGAMALLKAFFASIPYPEYGKEALNTFTKKEAYFQRLFYIVFSFMNVQIYTEIHNSEGRTDAVMFLADTIYVVESKLDAPSAKEAITQIDEKGYTRRFADKKVKKLGINFSSKTRTIEDWILE